MKRIRMLLAAFTALFLLMSALPAQAESPEMADLLAEFYDGGAELPFGLTEDELTCVDGVLYGRCAVWTGHSAAVSKDANKFLLRDSGRHRLCLGLCLYGQ